MNNVNNYLKRITIGQIFFFTMALSLLCFSAVSSTESKAFRYVTEIEHKNMDMLLDLAKIKIVLSEVADLKIDLVSGKINTVIAVIDNAEQLLFFSSVASLVQRVLLEVSKSQVYPISAMILIAIGLVFRMEITRKLLILLLAISPGLTLYSIGMHHFSSSLEKQLDSGLHSKLKLIAEKTDAEKSKLLREREESLKKESHENSFEKFVSRVKTDVVYDVERFSYDIKGDYEEIRALLNTGGANIVKELVVYLVHIILFFILSPLVYAYLVYRLTISRMMFGNQGAIKIKQVQPVSAVEDVKSSEKKIEPTIREKTDQELEGDEKGVIEGEGASGSKVDKTTDAAPQYDAPEKQDKEIVLESTVNHPEVSPSKSSVSNRAPLSVAKKREANMKSTDNTNSASANKKSLTSEKPSLTSAKSTSTRIGKGDGVRKKFM